MMDGYIKLARCLLEKAILQNPKLLQTWVWCLLKATHKEHEEMIGLKKVILTPGQFVTGRYKGSSELKMNPSTFWKNLLWLQNNQSLDIKSNNKFSVVTVINWELYQIELFKSDSKNDTKITTKEQQNNTNKNVKNVKNEKKVIKNTYSEFVKMTEAEYERLIKEFGQAATDRMIEILDNYKGANNKKYADDNRAIRNWVVKRYQEEQGQQKLFDQQPKKNKQEQQLDDLERIMNDYDRSNVRKTNEDVFRKLE
jgi:hypothetical protein